MNRADVEALLLEVVTEIALDLDAAMVAAYGLRSPVSLDVVALGKGATAMVERVPEARDALVVLPDGAPVPSRPSCARVLRAGHPLPDVRSVEAGVAALDRAHHGAADEVCVLVSGGSSSLAFAPIDGVTLEDARAVFDALLRSGASVRAMNVVRRHLSRLHGGGLVEGLRRGATVFVMSDVIGGAAHDVGSGPASTDPTTVDDARAVLRRYAPSFASIPLRETLKEAPAPGRFVEMIVAEPSRLSAVLAERLRRTGYATRILAPSVADVDAMAREYVALARALPARAAVVRSAEPSLIVPPGTGAGGRCSHLAALVARDLPRGVTFSAIASDGVDGASGTAGAVVSATSFPDRALLDRALATFDTGPLHRAAGTALTAGPTGLNLADVHALIRAG